MVYPYIPQFCYIKVGFKGNDELNRWQVSWLSYLECVCFRIYKMFHTASQIQVSIEQADGRPVISSTKDVEVAAYTKFFDRKLKNYRARVLWTKMFAPPSTGVLAIDVIPPLDTESLHLKVILLMVSWV